jgi:AraC family ethanolamine operon transcriptional activator
MTGQDSYPISANGLALHQQTYSDIDEQAACLSGYDQKYQQLSCGRFSGEFRTALFGERLGLYFERVNQVLDQWGAAPPDHYAVIFLMGDSAPCKINGEDFGVGDLAYFAPGGAFNTRSEAGTHFAVVSVERAYFEALARSCAPQFGDSLKTRGTSAIEHGSGRSAALRDMVNHAVDAAGNSADLAASSAALQGLQMSIGSLSAGYAAGQLFASPAHGRLVETCRFEIARKSRAFIHERRGVGVSVASLASRLGVSRRTLEYAFKAYFDQSPAAYIRSIQLNEVRRALIDAQNYERTIGDIAADWGIWHLSRFSQQYRRQFGELPSQTRGNQA